MKMDIIVCKSCGTKNRVPLAKVTLARCGKCKGIIYERERAEQNPSKDNVQTSSSNNGRDIVSILEEAIKLERYFKVALEKSTKKFSLVLEYFKVLLGAYLPYLIFYIISFSFVVDLMIKWSPIALSPNTAIIIICLLPSIFATILFFGGLKGWKNDQKQHYNEVTKAKEDVRKYKQRFNDLNIPMRYVNYKILKRMLDLAIHFDLKTHKEVYTYYDNELKHKELKDQIRYYGHY
jgi:hypothetical protein